MPLTSERGNFTYRNRNQGKGKTAQSPSVVKNALGFIENSIKILIQVMIKAHVVKGEQAHYITQTPPWRVDGGAATVQSGLLCSQLTGEKLYRLFGVCSCLCSSVPHLKVEKSLKHTLWPHTFEGTTIHWVLSSGGRKPSRSRDARQPVQLLICQLATQQSGHCGCSSILPSRGLLPFDYVCFCHYFCEYVYIVFNKTKEFLLH